MTRKMVRQFGRGPSCAEQHRWDGVNKRALGTAIILKTSGIQLSIYESIHIISYL